MGNTHLSLFMQFLKIFNVPHNGIAEGDGSTKVQVTPFPDSGFTIEFGFDYNDTVQYIKEV